jgi:GAF domain-containing protein
VDTLDPGAGHAADERASRDPPDQARLRQLAEEQAALRRVATLVARATPPEEVFAAVAEEVGRLFRVELATLTRYEPARTAVIVTTWGPADISLTVGVRWHLEGHNITTLVFETGRPARIDRYAGNSSGTPAAPRETGIRSAVGTPVIVEGHLWGLISIGSHREQPLPPDTEARLTSFTELVATAIANAHSRAELMASRARIVAAADEARRRIERDLHDGTQQQLVTLLLDLQAVQAGVPLELGELEDGLARIAGQVTEVIDRVREISRGIHPAILSEGGPAGRAEDAGTPVRGTGEAGPAHWAAAAPASRGRGVLRGVRGAGQCGQARASVRGARRAQRTWRDRAAGDPG